MELSKSGIDFATLLETDEPEVNENEDATSTGKRSRTHSTASSTRSSKKDEQREETPEKSKEQFAQLEASSKGQVHGSVSGAYLKSGANWFLLSIILALFVITQVIASGADYWVSFWTGQEELRQFYLQQNDTAEGVRNASTAIDDNYMQEFMPNMERSKLSEHTNIEWLAPKQTPWLDSVYGLLSTELCMYIHGGLIVSLFIFALVRLV